MITIEEILNAALDKLKALELEVERLKKENASFKLFSNADKLEIEMLNEEIERLKGSSEGVREKLKAYKLEHELPNDHIGVYNNGYVKAINDALNILPEPDFLPKGEEKKEEPKYECVDCKWIGTNEEKVRIRKSDVLDTLTCPECGQESFYNFREHSITDYKL